MVTATIMATVMTLMMMVMVAVMATGGGISMRARKLVIALVIINVVTASLMLRMMSTAIVRFFFLGWHWPWQ